MALPAILKDNLELPVVGSPLFIVSGPELVIAQCKAGVVGSFPALNARPVEKLDEWLSRIEDELGEYKALNPGKKVAPYAVNQICHASNDRLMKDMEICVKPQGSDHHHLAAAAEGDRRSRAFLWRTGVPRRHQRQACAESCRTGRRRTDPGLRRRRRPCRHAVALRAGARGEAVVQGHGAALRRDQRWLWHRLALTLGADLAYIGTRFIATAEANADEGYKTALTQHAAHDIVYTNLFTGVHGNYLGPSIAAAGLDPDNLPVADKTKMNFGSGGNMKSKAWRDIWGSGQGIGQIN